jgi:hypothetical protein
MKFEPPYERREFDRNTAPPRGRRPDGQWIVSAEDLPVLPIPKHAVVTKDFIEFDGWVFPLPCVTRSLLVWLQQTFIRWSKEDDSEENKEWINGLVKAFEAGLAGKL